MLTCPLRENEEARDDGPPYLTDDPEPTDYQHFEIYTFTNGTATRDGTSEEGCIDFNYGGASNLQLTATVPAGYINPSTGPLAWNLGNAELAVAALLQQRARILPASARETDRFRTGASIPS